MPDDIREYDQNFCEEIASKLHVHFDNVRIFVSCTESGETMGYTTGRGNWYAQIGQVGYWLDSQAEAEPDDNE